jgi:hypothetical protein
VVAGGTQRLVRALPTSSTSTRFEPELTAAEIAGASTSGGRPGSPLGIAAGHPENRRERERVDAQTPTPWRLLDRQVPGLTPVAVGAFRHMVKAQARPNNYEAARIAGVPADVAAELRAFTEFIRSLDYRDDTPCWYCC